MIKALDETAPEQVLFLGVYHFANPSRDVVKMDVADVLSPEKQLEIETVVKALAKCRKVKSFQLVHFLNGFPIAWDVNHKPQLSEFSYSRNINNILTITSSEPSKGRVG